MQEKYTIEYIKNNNLILLDAISGSHAYNTNNEHSDIDKRGVFICELDDYLIGDYPQQVSDEGNDITYYEIGRFIELLNKNNPNILELLNCPERCVEYRHPLMELIKPEEYISKLCKDTFGGYASTQIKKAKGLNKKIMNQMAPERKDPLDFCYVIDGKESQPLKEFLSENGLEQLFCGLSIIPHARDLYALFYDKKSHYIFSESLPLYLRKTIKFLLKVFGKSFGLGYKGILKENSDDIRLSSIPKGEKQIVIVSYNEDGFSVYCKQYREYFDWEKKRNEQRYNIASGKMFDPKNLMHCYRLCEMCLEILQGKGVNVHRENRDLLMKIRNGEMEYDEILSLVDNLIEETNKAFETSKLIDAPDINKSMQTLLKIRKSFYNLK